MDATATELRRLRALKNLLKQELIRQRFDSNSCLTTATDPEVEREDCVAADLQEIGAVDDTLLK